ncbi:MAG: translation initiation factor IF-2 [Phycisphaerales bacterium]
MAKRVFEVARELGVKSKEVLERCKAEGVPGMDNHMSAVSVGLEESIRNWFADNGASAQEESAVATATEEEPADEPTTKPKPSEVTKKKAKATKKKAAKKKVSKRPAKKVKKAEPRVAPTPPTRPARAASTETDERGVVPSTTERTTLEETPAPTEPVETTPAIAAEAEPVAPAAEAPTTPAAEVGEPVAEAPDATAEGAAPSRAAAVPNVPKRPDEVQPAGPQLGEVQKEAKLSGPKVVRVEEPEVIHPPRPRGGRQGGGGPGPGGRGAAPPMPSEPVQRGGGGGGGGGGFSRRNTRRKTSGRSGQSGRFSQGQGQGGSGARSRNWGRQDLIEREQRLRGAHGFIKTIRRDASKRQHTGSRAKTAKEIGGPVKVQEPITIKDLSSATGVRAADIVKKLFTTKGVMTNINAGLDTELAMEIMLDWGIELEVEEQKSAQDLVAESFQERESIDERRRPPVVTILGHVDHGKTSLLDRIRDAAVAEGEAGGITQHTSAFRVNVTAGESDKTIVFLDTPGHEAFTSMRARGARVTDIVVLVVAADDGVMPQTIESINHAKAAGVPIIVALNKIDKPEATDSNIQRIFGQLAEHEIAPADWGGDTELVKVSAITGDGIQDLLDVIDYQAELMELTSDFGGAARGAVIEAKMVEGRGPVANVLIQDGRIKVGDFIVVGRAYGRVRAMTDDRGERLDEAGPATPLEISGLSAVPDAGDTLYIVDSLRMAEEAAEQRQNLERERALATPKVTLDSVFSQIKESERKDLNLVVKADVQGSVETLRKSLEEISTDELNIRVLHAAVGGITESDVILAEASGAIIIGFHVIASSKARELAEQKKVELRTYQVIYELLDDVKMAAEGLLEPELREEVLGHAEVRQVFKVSKVGMIAGCYVTDGVIERNAKIRVTRDDIVIENNRVLEQLKRFKDDAKEVRAGQECGMKIEGYDDIKDGDILECYKTVEVKRRL